MIGNPMAHASSELVYASGWLFHTQPRGIMRETAFGTLTGALLPAILMHCALGFGARRRQAINQLRSIEKLNRRATLADQVYDSLRHAVIYGHLSRGSRLNQIDLAKNLDVSERTVREALAQLVSEGLVSRQPYREFRVVGLSAQEIEEIFHMRALLEGWAVELSALRISQDELDRMRELLPQMEAKNSPEWSTALQGANRQFHWIAINACKKKYLIQMLTRLWDLMLPYAFAERDTEGFVRQAQKDQIHHLRLVEALEAGAGKQARGILVDHVTEGMEALERRVKPPDQSGG